MLSLIKYSVDLYLIFLVLVVAVGLRVMYVRLIDHDLKNILVLPIFKFSLDMLNQAYKQKDFFHLIQRCYEFFMVIVVIAYMVWNIRHMHRLKHLVNTERLQ
jgi:hypothetical protein